MSVSKNTNKERRNFLLGSILKVGIAGAIGSGCYGFFVEPNWLRIKQYTLKSPKWSPQHKPLKIVAIADLHVGCPSVTLATVDKIVDHANSLNPDIILILGDFLIKGVLFGRHVPPAPIGERLAALKAPLGVYSVLGNHDWWEDGEGMWKALENEGIKVLENDAVHVKRDGGDFWIAGLADDTTREPDFQKTMKKITTNDPVILMTHDPATFMETDERPVVTLAGHTHGGQVAAPFFGAIIVPGRAPLKYAYGHIVEEGRDLIVSCGIGTSGLPVRFNRRPELIDLTISS